MDALASPDPGKGVIWVIDDITERKHAEELLRESESRLDMALTASNTGMWDFYPIEGRDFHNDQWYRQLGYEREDFDEGADHLVELMHPDDVDRFKSTLDEYARTKTEDYHLEFRLRGKDGAYRWISSRGRVLEWDPSGLPHRIVGVHLDITARKESETALKESEERVRKIVDSINTGIIIIDPADRIIVDVNPVAAQMIGADRENIIGQVCHRFICQADKNECPILDRGKEIDNTERELLTASGDRIPVLKTVVPVELSGKQYLLESFVDITERKQAEDQIRRHLEELERFNKLVIGRELKMIELKEEVNGLLTEGGRPSKYKIVE
jgi:PAS domain S-box-containing protein